MMNSSFTGLILADNVYYFE